MTFRILTNDELQTLYISTAKLLAEPKGIALEVLEQASEQMDAINAEWTARGLNYRSNVEGTD